MPSQLLNHDLSRNGLTVAAIRKPYSVFVAQAVVSISFCIGKQRSDHTSTEKSTFLALTRLRENSKSPASQSLVIGNEARRLLQDWMPSGVPRIAILGQTERLTHISCDAV